LTAGEATPMDDERIETGWFTAKDIETRIAKGSIVDAKTIVGMYAWKTFHRKG
jgi:ADP-ribose pyrophosphatase